jgi:hypothetical protein
MDMAKICEPCEFYSADNGVSVCPKCGSPTKLTMLPPRGEQAAPLKHLSQPQGLPPTHSTFSVVMKITAVTIPILISAAFLSYRLTGWQMNRPGKADPDKITVGMHISQAAKLVDHPDKNRFRDRFAPDDTSSGEYISQRGGKSVVLRWEAGRVTFIDIKPGAVEFGGVVRTTVKITTDGITESEEYEE